ncbi:MAG: hypothetical protein HDR92_01935 [Bacteroides sp.]|nr:hypothetical protein [Bacteroides sp.]
MGKILSITVTLLLALSIMAGCNSAGCVENQSSVPLAGFYSYTSGSAISIDSVQIGGIGAPNDSLIVSKGSIRSVYLPFRPGRESTSFFIRYTNTEARGVTDTLTFEYNTIPYFASEDCGALYRYYITGVSHTRWLLDSVALLDPEVINVDLELIQLYYTTSR